MSDYQSIDGGVCAPLGFHASAVSAGIKNPDADRLDMGLIRSTSRCVSAATFTINQVKAAPVRYSQAANESHDFQAIFANSGNANACTGETGAKDTTTIVEEVASALGIAPQEVGICATGVIGIPLPMDRLMPKIAPLIDGLADGKGDDVAAAIITSDTHAKSYAITVDIDGRPVRIGACAKGAGMISPCMATMLCFVTSDAQLSKADLQSAVSGCVDHSFNRITIDGDMSTNDTVICLANGQSGVEIASGTAAESAFRSALQHVLLHMAQLLVKDGERTTKFVTVQVKGAVSTEDAQKVAEAVANSALVKSSWNGNDPNWGRIIHAVGYSRAHITEEKIDISYNGTPACSKGLQAKTPMEELQKIAELAEFEITIDLNVGTATYEIYSSDLSPEYIDFNRSEYAYWKQARKDGLV